MNASTHVDLSYHPRNLDAIVRVSVSALPAELLAADVERRVRELIDPDLAAVRQLVADSPEALEERRLKQAVQDAERRSSEAGVAAGELDIKVQEQAKAGDFATALRSKRAKVQQDHTEAQEFTDTLRRELAAAVKARSDVEVRAFATARVGLVGRFRKLQDEATGTIADQLRPVLVELAATRQAEGRTMLPPWMA